MGMERIQNGYKNTNGMGTEWIQNGCRMEMERIRNGYESQKWKKANYKNANYKRTRSSEHMVVSYVIRVLTKDLETM